MAEVSLTKCHFFNIGYCKYKDKGCKHVHPKEACCIIKCKNKSCPNRHQKTCRYKESFKLKINQSCQYLHRNINQSENTSNDVVAENKNLIKKVKMLEGKIKENKKEIDNIVSEICKLEDALKIEKERTNVREKSVETG